MAATQELAAVLGVNSSQLAVLDRHGEREVVALTSGIRQALDRDDREVEAGMTQALRFVPGLLRGTAKKLLFGGH